jgi:hypothetical protein
MCNDFPLSVKVRIRICDKPIELVCDLREMHHDELIYRSLESQYEIVVPIVGDVQE